MLEEEMETLRIKESLRSYPEISQPLSNPHDPGGRTVPQVYGVGCFDFYFFSYCLACHHIVCLCETTSPSKREPGS